MLRRLLFTLVLPLLLAVVGLGLSQTDAAPWPTSNPSALQSGEPAPLNFYGFAGIAGTADVSSEEPEPLQASALDTRTPVQRHQWRAAAQTRWPWHMPDEPLRPPMWPPLL